MSEIIFGILIIIVMVLIYLSRTKKKLGNNCQNEQKQEILNQHTPVPVILTSSSKPYYSLDFDFTIFTKKRIFTNNEQEFFLCLQQVAKDKCYIFSKVRLLDILRINDDLKYTNPDLYYSAFNKVAKMHLDFILITKDRHYIECIIELDDKTHINRTERDAFLNRVIETISFPFIRIPAKQNGSYSPEYVLQHLRRLQSFKID